MRFYLGGVSAYGQLLETAIGHLEAERTRGRQHVEVDGEKLAALFRPVPRTTGNVSFAPSPDSAGDTPNNFAELRTQVLACEQCPKLVASRKTIVFGVGNEAADLMFVGEAPGADEDAQGEPFVGAAGQLLTKIIAAMGLSREEVYIANILKCRPDTPGQGSGNRPPTREEMDTCSPWLHRQIEHIAPKVIVALGKTAVGGLLEQENVPITKFRGTWCEYCGIPLMPTFHPAYLLHQQSLASKRALWEDMLAVMEKLSLSISEKQRGYFLPR